MHDVTAATKEIIQLNEQSKDAFQQALNNACGEINEAARLSNELFRGEGLSAVRRELARLMEIIDSKLLGRLSAPRP